MQWSITAQSWLCWHSPWLETFFREQTTAYLEEVPCQQDRRVSSKELSVPSRLRVIEMIMCVMQRSDLRQKRYSAISRFKLMFMMTVSTFGISVPVQSLTQRCSLWIEVIFPTCRDSSDGGRCLLVHRLSKSMLCSAVLLRHTNLHRPTMLHSRSRDLCNTLISTADPRSTCEDLAQRTWQCNL